MVEEVRIWILGATRWRPPCCVYFPSWPVGASVRKIPVGSFIKNKLWAYVFTIQFEVQCCRLTAAQHPQTSMRPSRGLCCGLMQGCLSVCWQPSFQSGHSSTVWLLVGNGGMDYGDYYCGLYRDYYIDPVPHSLRSTRQSNSHDRVLDSTSKPPATLAGSNSLNSISPRHHFKERYFHNQPRVPHSCFTQSHQ